MVRLATYRFLSLHLHFCSIAGFLLIAVLGASVITLIEVIIF